LNTGYKPVCNAIVKKYDEETDKYEVACRYPDPNKTEMLIVPQERLMIPLEFEKSILPNNLF
jgi:hypothetical protein